MLKAMSCVIAIVLVTALLSPHAAAQCTSANPWIDGLEVSVTVDSGYAYVIIKDILDEAIVALEEGVGVYSDEFVQWYLICDEFGNIASFSAASNSEYVEWSAAFTMAYGKNGCEVEIIWTDSCDCNGTGVRAYNCTPTRCQNRDVCMLMQLPNGQDSGWCEP